MPVVALPDILHPAFEQRYGVAAFNIVNDLTMEAVLEAATQAQSPVIIQVSVKTAKQMGAKLIQLMFTEMANQRPIPATLHLDHCPDVAFAKECLDAGWNSVLFDGSGLSYAENLQQTRELVQLARHYGAGIEGELEAVKGVEDGIGSAEEGHIVPLDQAVEFVRETGIDCFAPAIGTAHGLYDKEPQINYARVTEIVETEPIPIVLHGGTGLSDDVFRNLIALGIAKINISTKLRITLADSFRTYLEAHPTEYDPLKLFGAVREDLIVMAKDFMHTFGSAGKAT